MSKALALGVLVSGRGSNLAAIIGAIEAGRLPAEIRAVISDNPEAPALAVAAGRGIPALVADRKNFADQTAFEGRIVELLRNQGVDLVVLAGFMRLAGPTLLSAFRDRIVNIHPSLLPAFPGLAAQKQALEYGVKISGCTVHWVNEVMDGGRIIAQAAVPVLDDDTEETLSARILAEEHRLLPEVLARLARPGGGE